MRLFAVPNPIAAMADLRQRRAVDRPQGAGVPAPLTVDGVERRFDGNGGTDVFARGVAPAEIHESFDAQRRGDPDRRLDDELQVRFVVRTRPGETGRPVVVPGVLHTGEEPHPVGTNGPAHLRARLTPV